MRRTGYSTFGILESPLLVGTITTLVIFVAMFISYNANNGLPFVPTYTLIATAPNADNLLPGGQVLIGGRRVGFVQSIQPDLDDDGTPVARLVLQLDLDIEGSIKEDATVRIRPLSVFEYKYLDLIPGTADKALPEGSTLPESSTLGNVGLAQTFAAFDSKTRANLDRTLVGFGDGLAGRGASLNAAFGDGAKLFREVQPILADLADPATGLARFTAAFARFTAELAPAAGDLAGLFRNGRITFAAFEAAGPEFEQALDRLPGTITTSRDVIGTLTPILTKAADLTAKVEPVADLLPSVSRRVTDAIERTTPVLGRVPSQQDELDDALSGLGSLAADHPLEPSLTRLTEATDYLTPTLRFIVPYQTVCNYIVLSQRNISSTVSEGNASGTWMRFQLFLPFAEIMGASEPAHNLHYNPYPAGAAPSQKKECEAGNAEFKPGQQIGEVPGKQPAHTEATTPESFK